jgi:hypothetical protein
VEEVLQIIRNRLSTDPSFPELTFTSWRHKGIAGHLFKNCILRVWEWILSARKGIAMGNSLSLVVRNIFMVHFEEIALGTANHKPGKWLTYVDTVVIWPHGPARLQVSSHSEQR